MWVPSKAEMTLRQLEEAEQQNAQQVPHATLQWDWILPQKLIVDTPQPKPNFSPTYSKKLPTPPVPTNPFPPSWLSFCASLPPHPCNGFEKVDGGWVGVCVCGWRVR